MKKYLIFIFSISYIYSMESPKREPEDLLLAYLPTAPSNQSYFTRQEIEQIKTPNSIQTYFSFLKNKTLETRDNTIATLISIINSANADKENPIYQEAELLMAALVNDHVNWQHTSKIPPRFHPLLFLKHRNKNIKFIIFDEKTWFDIEKGTIIQIASSNDNSTTPKKTYDRHKYSVKKQKLVQDGR